MPDQTAVAELVKKAQGGDGEAFVALMGTMREQLHRTALAILRRPDAALQAIEDASYSAFLHIRQLRNPKYATTWLTRILINACIKQLRHEKRSLPLTLAAEQAGPDGQGAVDLRDAVARLPHDLCVAVSVRYFGGMTVAETAGVLGLPEGTVKTRLRRALSILRLELEV